MLRIDLLPKAIILGRRNVRVAAICVVAVLLSAVVMFLMLQQTKTSIAKTEEALADAKLRADEVRKLQGEASSKKAELAPIQAKIDFVEAADQSGEQFFDRFWKISEYIYSGAQMTNFQITPPASVSFTVTVGDTTEAGRFVLNLIRCPHITGIQIGGMPAGDTVQPSGSTMATVQESSIVFSVSATLTEAVAVPQPPSDAGGGGGGPAMGGPEDMMMGGFDDMGVPPPPEDLPDPGEAA